MPQTDLIENVIRNARTLDEAAHALERLLSGGYNVLPDGRLNKIKELVDSVKGLKIYIYAKEDAPPHFHVLAPDMSAKFRIDDGSLIKGEANGKQRKLIEYWYALCRPLLIETWNRTRPGNCPVGPVKA